MWSKAKLVSDAHPIKPPKPERQGDAGEVWTAEPLASGQPEPAKGNSEPEKGTATDAHQGYIPGGQGGS